jgi:hypothetical protein
MNRPGHRPPRRENRHSPADADLVQNPAGDELHHGIRGQEGVDDGGVVGAGKIELFAEGRGSHGEALAVDVIDHGAQEAGGDDPPSQVADQPPRTAPDCLGFNHHVTIEFRGLRRLMAVSVTHIGEMSSFRPTATTT